MIQEQSRFLQRCLFVVDLLCIAMAWVAAYYLRFEVLTPPEWFPFSKYFGFLPVVLITWGVAFVLSGLYATARAQRLSSVVLSVARAVFFGLVVVIGSLFFYRDFSFSRMHMLFFGMFTPALMITVRLTIYSVIRRARRHGRYLRRVLIIGAGTGGRRLQHAFNQYPWMGFDVVGFLDDAETGHDILGTTAELPETMAQFAQKNKPLDDVYITLPLKAEEKIADLVGFLSTSLARVYLIPGVFQFDILNGRISDIEGMPVIHVIDEAPIDVQQFVKRLIDVAFSAGFLVVISPLLLLIAIAVKLSSPGPIFYRQERMGLNGQTFHMLKFRSMPVTAEAKSGPVWAQAGEQRATRVGAFLRRTSLDELPQFFNVLRGEMAVVGPRPERPFFIEQFKDHVPLYMLRHKMKAGITGWAQVNGWRGNTSIEKRIEYDLYYIQNWSLGLDFRIMWMTVWRGFRHKNAY